MCEGPTSLLRGCGLLAAVAALAFLLAGCGTTETVKSTPVAAEPAPVAEPAPTPGAGAWQLEVSLDAPTPNWKIVIEEVVVGESGTRILSRLSQIDPDAMAAQVITPITDRVRLREQPENPVRQYILGNRRWSPEMTEGFLFIESIDAFRKAAAGGRVVYRRP